MRMRGVSTQLCRQNCSLDPASLSLCLCTEPSTNGSQSWWRLNVVLPKYRVTPTTTASGSIPNRNLRVPFQNKDDSSRWVHPPLLSTDSWTCAVTQTWATPHSLLCLGEFMFQTLFFYCQGEPRKTLENCARKQ